MIDQGRAEVAEIVVDPDRVHGGELAGHLRVRGAHRDQAPELVVADGGGLTLHVVGLEDEAEATVVGVHAGRERQVPTPHRLARRWRSRRCRGSR